MTTVIIFNYYSRVFLGVSLTPEKIKKLYKPGKEFRWQGFVSTSISANVAKEFSQRNLTPDKRRVVFEIRRTASHPTAAKIWDFAVDEYKWEKEVLMIPGVRFKVLSKYVRGDITYIVVREICLDKHG